MAELIFRTVHGSHLYGFAHAGSDYDLYEVYEGTGRKLRQKTDGEYDLVTGTLDAFLLRAASGSHQSAEAIFSPEKEWGPGMEEKYGALLDNFRLGAEAHEKYERTIRKFAHGDFKKRRHACRLAVNLWELRVSGSGRFNPRLHYVDRTLCEGYARAFTGSDFLEQLQDLMNPQRGWEVT